MKKLSVLLVVIALWSCDKIEDPLKPPVFTCGDCQASASDPFITTPNVIIEEFTGHQCNNCPLAAAEAQSLIAANPGRVFTIGIHAGGFANINADYPTDFTTTEGTEIFNWASPPGVPMGLVNRLDFGSPTFNKLYGKWSSETDGILQGSAKMGMILETAVDTNTRELCLTAKFKALEDLSGVELRWCAFITEGHIKSPQKMPDNTKNKDYLHEHVLRAAINGTFGSNLDDFTGAINEVTCQTRAYSLSQDWQIENCEVVVYVYDYHQSGSGEILQVLAEHL